MPILIAAVVIVGVLCLLDLLLTFGVIRRLREHTEFLRARQPFADRPVIGLDPGQAPEPFTVMTSDEVPLSYPAGLRVAGFFASFCSACPERVAPFLAYVRANGIPRDDVLVVLLPGDDGPPEYMSRLAEVAQVALETEDGPATKAFGVSGYPAFCLLDANGAVITSGFDPAALPAPALA